MKRIIGIVCLIGIFVAACSNTTQPAVTPTADRFKANTPAQGDSGPNSSSSVAGPGGLSDPNLGTVAVPTSAVTVSAGSASTRTVSNASSMVSTASLSPCPSLATAAVPANATAGATAAVIAANATAPTVAAATPQSASQSAAATATVSSTQAANVSVPQGNATGNPNTPYLGITGQDIPNCGVTITAIRPGSAAEVDKLQVGDLIVSIDHQPVMSMQTIQTILNAHKVPDHIIISVIRNKQPSDVGVTLMAQPVGSVATRQATALGAQEPSTPAQ